MSSKPVFPHSEIMNFTLLKSIIPLSVKYSHGMSSSSNYVKVQKVDIHTLYQCLQNLFLLTVK